MNFIVQDDPAEASYSYEMRVHNFHMKGGRILARVMTEEEKMEAEANKGKKPAEKKGKKDEEPTPEELEKYEAEKKQREDENNKL